jgi:hypothetical protein
VSFDLYFPALSLSSAENMFAFRTNDPMAATGEVITGDERTFMVAVTRRSADAGLSDSASFWHNCTLFVLFQGKASPTRRSVDAL